MRLFLILLCTLLPCQAEGKGSPSRSLQGLRLGSSYRAVRRVASKKRWRSKWKKWKSRKCKVRVYRYKSRKAHIFVSFYRGRVFRIARILDALVAPVYLLGVDKCITLQYNAIHKQ